MAKLEITDLIKSFGDGTRAVDAITFSVEENEFVVIVGPSGCGKSTTLRMIAGIEEETSGDICIGGERVNDLSPGARDVAMVFQNYALYPHMTVAQNIGFGLRRRGMRRADVAKAVQEAAEVLELGALLDRRPATLSGGQRQRVAMGRAMVRRPKLFLFDEPLSNLDARLRLSMRSEIRRLQSHIRTTTLYVTHDQTEAMTLADRVIVMKDGRIEQIGAPMDIYRRPASLFVAQFIGSPTINVLDATMGDTGAHLSDGTELEIATTGLSGQHVSVGLRPEAITLGNANGLPARVETLEPLGQELIVEFSTQAAGRLWSRLPPETVLHHGETVQLCLDASQAHVFDTQTGRALPNTS